MRISVLGCGRWGSFLAWYAQKLGHDTMLWGRPGSQHLQYLIHARKNEYVTIPDALHLTSDLEEALIHGDVIVVSVSSQQFRTLARNISSFPIKTRSKPFILCMKGLEIATGKRLSVIAEEELGAASSIAVWVGPGHVQDFTQGMPNCMVMSSHNESLTRYLIDVFTSPLIRFYYSRDLLGTEIGAAAKNVMGIAAGMLDGAKLTSLKGALMARGTHELSVLIKKLGGDPMTVYGLSHLGDYEATLFSMHSNNRLFGEYFIQKKNFSKLAEGYYTTEALLHLSQSIDTELPITEALYDILYNKKNPHAVLEKLFLRSLKEE